jgi:hypothetical protein
MPVCMILDMWNRGSLGYRDIYTTDVWYANGVHTFWYGPNIEPDLNFYWRG